MTNSPAWIGPGGPRAYENNGQLSIAYGDTGNLDAFGRLRTSGRPTSLFTSSQVYNDNPLLWETTTAGSGSATHSNALAATTLAVTAEGDSVIRQTRAYHHYQPSRGHLIFKTFVLGATVPGVTKRTGYFDAGDGIFLQATSSGLAIVLRSSTSGSPLETVINQADWNIDPLDGTGSSGYTLDVTKSQKY